MEDNRVTKKTHEKSSHVKFTPEEDKKLKEIVDQVGTSSWPNVAKYLKGRSSRQCRDRWNHYLSPTANLAEWTPQDEELLLSLFRQYGTKWAFISTHFPGRTAACVRTHCCRLQRMIERTASRPQHHSQQVQQSPITMVNIVPDYGQVISQPYIPQQAPQLVPQRNSYSSTPLPSIYQFILY